MSRNTTNDVPPDILDNEEDDEAVGLESGSDVEFDLEVVDTLKLPPDLAQRPLPAQAASVDGAALLKAAQLPTRKERRWHIELAPLSRLQAWQLPEIKNGDAVSMLGYTFAGEKGAAVLRAEYLWAGGKAVGLRSSPA